MCALPSLSSQQPSSATMNDADVDNDLFLEPNIAWNDPSVCVSCERVNTGRPEGQGLTVTSDRPLWTLPV